MLKYFVFVAFLSLCACVTTPDNPERWMESQKNSCLPTAITFKQSLRKHDVWAKVMRYDWFEKTDKGVTKQRGHAMCVYMYPPGKNQLWTYDAFGSYRVRAYLKEVKIIAQEAHYARGLTNKVVFAEYLD